MAMIMRDHALGFAADDVPVFQIWGVIEEVVLAEVIRRLCGCGDPDCSRPGKHPMVAGGFKAATTDVETITRWWTANPNANIGIPTGKVSGLVVVDVDIGPGKDGLASLKELEGRFFPISKGVAVRTGSGGLHFYFRAPSVDIKSSVSKLAKHIDIRGEGGYIIAPPSMHISGNRYVWENFND